MVFFSDKGMFLTSLITPMILLVLYATFLAGVYKDSFVSSLPVGFLIDEKIINATVGGQLISSLLAVSCVTVSFCSNLLMVGDKASGVRRDLTVSPISGADLGIGYFAASAIVSILINLAALVVCVIYISFTGCFMSATDILLMVLDIILLTLFGTSVSSCIVFPLKSNGQASAVGTIVSSGYGFICGAYMPISSFPDTLGKVLSFLPGTYGTALVRTHALSGTFDEMESAGIPSSVVVEIKKSIDCSVSFFGHEVSTAIMYAIVCGSILLFTALYIFFMSRAKSKK